MHEETFEVGDLVRVKTWEEMESQYGLTRHGEINVPYGFFRGMRHLCGLEFVITNIAEYEKVYGHNTGYSLSTHCVTHVQDELFNTDGIDVFLSNY